MAQDAQMLNTHEILVVDDSTANLKLLSDMLVEHGYDARTVPSGKLALLAAELDPPDLILLDINMPEMNGFEVCAHLKKKPKLKDIPIIFLTANMETADKVKGFSLGAVDYITKPFHVEEILARVRTHLDIRTMQSQLKTYNERLEELVDDRTAELGKAYKQVKELNQLKNDFLLMISHEIRTPAHGLLYSGDQLLDVCPPSEDSDSYCDIFKNSSSRLSNLINDVTMLIDLEKSTANKQSTITFPALFAKATEALPDIQVSMLQSEPLDTVLLWGERTLLVNAMKTIIQIAASFSKKAKDKPAAHIDLDIKGKYMRVRLQVDAMSLSKTKADTFFEMASLSRTVSTAEYLGLAPVVAERILNAFGGGLRLLKGEGDSGCVEAVLLIDKP